MKQLVKLNKDKDVGTARLQEEAALHLKDKLEAEGRLKKFEAKFRQTLKELDDSREQLEQFKEKAIYEDGSDSLSFMMNQSNAINGSSHQV